MMNCRMLLSQFRSACRRFSDYVMDEISNFGWNRKVQGIFFGLCIFLITTLNLLIHTHNASMHGSKSPISVSGNSNRLEYQQPVNPAKNILRSWLEEEGVYTNESSSVDLLRQTSFRMTYYRPELKLDELLTLRPSDLVFRLDTLGIRTSSQESKKHTILLTSSNPYVVSRMHDSRWQRSESEYDVIIAIPFHQNELPKVRVWLEAWHDFPPCRENWRAAPKSVRVHLVFAYAGSLDSGDGKIVSKSLQRLWASLGPMNKCFASVNFESLKQPGKFGLVDGSCISFHVLMHMFHNTPVAAMQIVESDAFPVRQNWLEEFAYFADPSHACSEWWVKGSPSMCKTSFSPPTPIDIQRDFHINGNALYALNCPAFEDFLIRIQLYYPSRVDKGWRARIAGGCETGRSNQRGYDRIMYHYRNEPENYIFARRHLDKFQYAYFLANYCEDIYNHTEVRSINPRTQWVHSKSAFLSKRTQDIFDAFSDALDKPGTASELNTTFVKLLPLLYSGELDLNGLNRVAQLAVIKKMEIPDGVFIPPSWRDAYPGKFYIWTADFHAGPMACQLPVFTEAGAVVHLETDYDDCEVYGYCKKRLQVLSFDKRKGFSLESGGLVSADLKKAFYSAYKSDPEFARVNAFFCSYPAANCQLFMPFKKPIIIYATTRLEFGRHDGGLHWRQSQWTKQKGKDDWQKWVFDLQTLASTPNNIIAASSLYDVAYIKYFSGVEAQHMPLWCGDCNIDYDSIRAGNSLYQPYPRYLPVKNKFLIGPHRTNLNVLRNGTSIGPADDHPIMRSLRSVLLPRDSSATIASISKEFPSHYSKAELCRYLGVILVPDQVSSISIMEYYRMNIPLFSPSISLLVQWYKEYGILWERIYGWPEMLYQQEDSLIPDPNEDSLYSFQYWIRYADWYQLPHVQLFDNYTHLADLLENCDLQQISLSMEEFNQVERSRLVGTWQTIFDKLR